LDSEEEEGKDWSDLEEEAAKGYYHSFYRIKLKHLNWFVLQPIVSKRVRRTRRNATESGKAVNRWPRRRSDGAN